jgi:hypothetical protein
VGVSSASEGELARVHCIVRHRLTDIVTQVHM